MSDLTTAWHHNSGGPARVWYQSFVDPQKQRPYIDRLPDCLTDYAEPSVSFEVHGVSPPDRYLSALSEFRCADQAIRHANQAEQQGYDAFVIDHFQEPGLVECRSAVEIPSLASSPSTPPSSPGIATRSLASASASGNGRLAFGRSTRRSRAAHRRLRMITLQQVKDEFCQQALP